MITLEDLEYSLPLERIAQTPARPRDASRLLILDRETDRLTEIRFSELPDRLGPEDLLVVNDTRVLPAKLRGRKASGGRAEALLIGKRPDGSWQALLKSRGRARVGLELRFGELHAVVREVLSDGSVVLELSAVGGLAPLELLEKCGEAPLPPYIRRDHVAREDLEDYQSIFAQEPGAIAAPTASLHFTPALAARLRLAKLTLHVGTGTFRPLRDAPLDKQSLDEERFEIPPTTAEAIAEARASGGRVIAVGTTVVRALETTGGEAGRGHTELLIRPGHRFRVVDSMITNFHLPRSSLLLLVMAFAGVESIRRAYRYAIAEGFRFYSYGDAMWIR